jgi:NADH:ubiquinone oxidoreductase subunit D
LTGNVEAPTKLHPGWFSRLTQTPHHYFAIDGGSGAHLLAALARRSPYLKQVASPRHADLLLVVEPISQQLAPAVVEVARALARPARVLVLGELEPELHSFLGGVLASVEDLLPGAQRLSLPSVEAVLDAALHPEQPALPFSNTSGPEPVTISLPSRQEQEMATELVVLSLGPIQPFTAGPLRVFLICDGEQVFSTQMEAAYAHRGIAQAMMQANWQQALPLARQLDPLAPLAGQLAYVSAVEQLQQWHLPAPLLALREAALALERAQNVLWWLVRFASILADVRLIPRSSQLASRLAEHTVQLWQQPPEVWTLPQYSIPTALARGNAPALTQLQELAEQVEVLRRDIERNRLLALRTRDIGVLTTQQLKRAGVSGPVLGASEQEHGDVQTRLLVRLDAATFDLREAVERLRGAESVPVHAADWDVPAGEAYVTVKGPRGEIGLQVSSAGEEGPGHVEWQRPSAALLPLLPELLAGQKLADAEVLLASLDLAMAEADG